VAYLNASGQPDAWGMGQITRCICGRCEFSLQWLVLSLDRYCLAACRGLRRAGIPQKILKSDFHDHQVTPCAAHSIVPQRLVNMPESPAASPSGQGHGPAGGGAPAKIIGAV